jgi:hypothetical protein
MFGIEVDLVEGGAVDPTTGPAVVLEVEGGTVDPTTGPAVVLEVEGTEVDPATGPAVVLEVVAEGLWIIKVWPTWILSPWILFKERKSAVRIPRDAAIVLRESPGWTT